MRKAEWILSLVAEPERAAALAGDLAETDSPVLPVFFSLFMHRLMDWRVGVLAIAGFVAQIVLGAVPPRFIARWGGTHELLTAPVVLGLKMWFLVLMFAIGWCFEKLRRGGGLAASCALLIVNCLLIFYAFSWAHRSLLQILSLTTHFSGYVLLAMVGAIVARRRSLAVKRA
jgi:hypothetical protein